MAVAEIAMLEQTLHFCRGKMPHCVMKTLEKFELLVVRYVRVDKLPSESAKVKRRLSVIEAVHDIHLRV